MTNIIQHSKKDNMKHIIQHSNESVNTHSQVSYNTQSHNMSCPVIAEVTISFGDSGRSILTHLWCKLLNERVTGMLFKSSELAEKGGCTTRSVYTFLKGREDAGEIKVENKGRNGLLITMLKKGWELSQSFKFELQNDFKFTREGESK